MKLPNARILLIVPLFFIFAGTVNASTFLPNQWVPNISGNLLYANQQWFVENANKTWSFSSSDNNAIRYEVRSGDVWTAVDPPSKERSEIDGGPAAIATGTPITISYQYMLEPGPNVTSSFFVTGQFHQTAESGAGSSFSPSFAIGVGPLQNMTIEGLFQNSSTTQAPLFLYQDPNTITRNHWYNMFIQVLFSDSSSGYAYVWRDGTLIASYNGPIGDRTELAEFWKEGIYRAAASQTEAADYQNLVISTSTTPVVATSSVAVSVAVVPSTVVKGGTIDVVWNSLAATSCHTSGFTGHTDIGFDKTLTNIQSNATYTVACTGPGGTATSSASVTVINSPFSNFIKLFGLVRLFGKVFLR